MAGEICSGRGRGDRGRRMRHQRRLGGDVYFRLCAVAVAPCIAPSRPLSSSPPPHSRLLQILCSRRRTPLALLTCSKPISFSENAAHRSALRSSPAYLSTSCLIHAATAPLASCLDPAMMGLFNQAAQKVYKPRGTSEDDKAPEDTEPDDTSILSVTSSAPHALLLPR